jgi:hypothetical protein
MFNRNRSLDSVIIYATAALLLCRPQDDSGQTPGRRRKMPVAPFDMLLFTNNH